MTLQAASAVAADPWRRLHLDHDSGVPIWVQLKTQLEYVIATASVPAGTRLPSVRELSSRVGAAIDTVRQAYAALERTGLVVTHRGAGTFTSLPAGDGRDAVTSEVNWGRADAALVELVRSGCEPRAAARPLAQRLALVHHGIDVVFVGVPASAARYARLISDQLAPSLAPVRPVSLEELRNHPLATDLGRATYAVSLAFHAREVEGLLSDRPIRVLALTSKLQEGVLADLPTSPDRRVVLVARPETRPIYTELLRDQRPDLVDLPFAPDADERAVADAVGHADVVLHTSAAASLVQRFAGAQHTLIELVHVPQEKSLHHLVETLRSDHELMLELQRAHLGAT